MQNACNNTWWNYDSCPMKCKDHDNVCCCYYTDIAFGEGQRVVMCVGWCGWGGGGGR